MIAGLADHQHVGTAFGLARYKPDGTLDRTFDGDGRKQTSFGEGVDYANDLVIQLDGKIVAAGLSSTTENDVIAQDFGLARYNPDGTLDPTFSADGVLTTDFGETQDVARAVAPQVDGKIVAAGGRSPFASENSDFAIARYNLDGSLDSTFSRDGLVTTDFVRDIDIAFAVAAQPDGKIVAAGLASSSGNQTFGLVRYNPDGTLDTSFSDDGKVRTDFGAPVSLVRDVAIQTDGKIVAAGFGSVFTASDFALSRYGPDGTPDPTFSNDGRVLTDFGSLLTDEAHGVKIQADGKIVAAGEATDRREDVDFALIRYNSDGSLDSTFSHDGKLTTSLAADEDRAFDLAIQADGKIVAAGYAPTGKKDDDFAVTRYLGN